VVAFQGRTPRPNNGAVADNGSFSFEDWHFGNTLSGTFNVFHADGRPIITKELTANIVESGISRNGRLAFCITANSSTEDGHKLFLFDLSIGLELFSVTPQRFRVDGYTFDGKKIELIAKISGGGEYRYGAAGELIDAGKADDAYLHSTSYDAIILTAQKLFAEQALSPEKAREVLVAVICARSLGADTNPAWKPTALKVQGLAHELLSEYREAIALYEEALSLNPKIGVKRKLDSLRKRLD